jgi:hypothetical protein
VFESPDILVGAHGTKGQYVLVAESVYEALAALGRIDKVPFEIRHRDFADES